MTKHILKEEAVSLRKNGYSYGDIMKKIKVSKSTLSYWLSSIKYIPNEEARLRISKARIAAITTKRNQRLNSIYDASITAKKDIGTLNKRDLFMMGLGIYIGEGTKTHNIVRIANSDPVIIKFMIKWFKEICGLGNENMMIRIHLYPDNNLEESENFWSKEVKLPRKNFFTSYIDTRKNKKKLKVGKSVHGTAHLCIKSSGKKEFGVLLSRKICAWINEVLRCRT